MILLRIIPSHVLILLAYNIALLKYGDQTAVVLSQPLFTKTLSSGAQIVVSLNDLAILAGVGLLYVEILKATMSSRMSIVEHMLSLLVFLIFLIEFILVKNLGTVPFFIITMITFIDLAGGFTISIIAARRDIAVG